MVGVSLTSQGLTDALLGIAIVVWICYRQTTWRVIDPARVWRGPAVLGVVGLATLVPRGGAVPFTALDLAVVALELALALAVGSAMGAVARFRPLTPDAVARYEAGDRAGRPTPGTVRYETRTGATGIALWVALIAVRIAADVVAVHLGAHVAAGTAMILLALAANRAARTAVLTLRLQRLDAVAPPVTA